MSEKKKHTVRQDLILTSEPSVKTRWCDAWTRRREETDKNPDELLDMTAFVPEEWVSKNWGAICGWVTKYAVCTVDVDDLLQDAYVCAVLAAKKVCKDGADQVYAWLFWGHFMVFMKREYMSARTLSISLDKVFIDTLWEEDACEQEAYYGEGSLFMGPEERVLSQEATTREFNAGNALKRIEEEWEDISELLSPHQRGAVAAALGMGMDGCQSLNELERSQGIKKTTGSARIRSGFQRLAGALGGDGEKEKQSAT